MSWQAMEAVQDHSTWNDHTALCILYAIARCADGSGVAGANGRQTSPSIDRIAALARCHRNTILNWLPRLEESGELQVERFGKGRGAWNRYTILLPMPAANGTNNGTSRIDHNGSNGTSNGPGMVQVMVQNGTTRDVPDTKDTKTPPNPPTVLHAGSAGDGEEIPAIQELAEYFCQITGRKMPRKLNSTHADTYWWEPLVEIYHQHDTFLDTKRAMYAAVQYANDASLTVTTPHSLRNLAVASARDHSGYRDKDGILVVSGR